MPLRNTVEWLNELGIISFLLLSFNRLSIYLDGRDRFTKVIQYVSLILKYYFTHQKNVYLEDKFLNLFSKELK